MAIGPPRAIRAEMPSVSACSGTVRSAATIAITVEAGGRAVRGRLAASCDPSPRSSAIENPGSSSSCSNSVRLTRSMRLSRLARTEAARGEPVSSASSPIVSPRPISRRTSGGSSAIATSRPLATTYSASPGSPARKSHCPARKSSHSPPCTRLARISSLSPARIGTSANASPTPGAMGDLKT